MTRCETFICTLCFEEVQGLPEKDLVHCGQRMVELSLFLADVKGHLLAREHALKVKSEHAND